MPLSDEDAAALIAEVERAKRELERAKWEKELQKREFEVELEWLQYEAELECLQPENAKMPMFPLLEGPQQSAPTAVALAAEAPATEVMTDTRVFPDTAAPGASVERAAIKLTSAAGPSSKICGERRASTGTLFPLEVRYHNSSGNGSNSNSSNSSTSSGNGSNRNSSNSSKSNSRSSSSSNDTTSNHDSWWEATCVIALLRPFDPGKGCQRDARRGRAVLGVNLRFDRGKSWGRMQHGR